ncbi:P-loop containing nucleoside triphosphate hydrolase protein [Scheffersomyces xylosifermentans]|uniref:P-loop containing nucleoside triphosphate hydrolase protein n=1 Tax=Scheffersomyces xylosifermentans TaxID=1304137 RepID=UPI00315D7414
MQDDDSNYIDSRLDPNSNDFDPKFWLEYLMKVKLSDPEYYNTSSLGLAFKNLRCYGRSVFPDIGTSDNFDILKPMEGLIKRGELTVVLGRPGAGCSTFLKTIACQTYGFHVDKESVINYDGFTPYDIRNHFRGDVIYCAETENHFAHLTVGETLEFAAMLRTPQNRPHGISRKLYTKHMDVVMATYGLSHTKNTKVGDEFIRGVSGGERMRVSIAEVTLSQASVQCWDNSTRGLDSATALEFIQALKTSAVILKSTPLVAIYQCSQDAYDLFDKIVLLYEGYEIFFGSTKDAKQYFLDMGYYCPQRQTTADFLTSISNPSERQVKNGCEQMVPTTPEEFYNHWQRSQHRKMLMRAIEEYIEETSSGESKERFHQSHIAKQSNYLAPSSPFTVSFFMQVKYVIHRNMRTRGDTNSFYYTTAALSFAILFNAFSSILEIFSLYEGRAIVEKHKKYVLYHPSADALASILTELVPKVCTYIGSFFFFLFVNFTATISMSHLLRTIGAATKSLSQAMTPASILVLALTIFTGFMIPTPAMLGWCRWINYINPIAYAFEALIANEFSNRKFTCSQFYINIAFEYYGSHKWRNVGIIICFIILFLFTYLIICEYNQEAALKTRRKLKLDIESGKVEKILPQNDLEDSATQVSDSSKIKGKNTFHWRDLTYEVKIKDENRIILNKVDGWVKPGQVTALMGASGAGKTTLLNALSDRLTTGVITDGVKMVNGRPLNACLQRSIGYVQQQDLHLQTSTVRQPNEVPKKEKDEYVEYIISLLEMQAYADAVVGVTGEGLNVEQRKRLSIGVELFAKPKLLLFLDEPTSGLDSQTAWSICKLIRKLADNGQAVLCTIHQPSAILMEEFRGGETVYFGNLGRKFRTLIDYFERNGAPACPPHANPVEWMNSREYRIVQYNLDWMEEELVKIPIDDSPDKYDTFATSFWTQYFLQNWRTPSYTYSKMLSGVASTLFNGAFFKTNNYIQGLQNQMFSVFTFLMVFNILVHQYSAHFVSQRDLYEVRERHSKTFGWLAFITAQITAEIPWNIFIGTLAFFC